MGMAASQARLLMLTARIHDTEYQAQMIQNAKLQLATQEDEVYRKYNEALDATTLTFTNSNNEIIPANFLNLCGARSINNGLNTNYILRTGDSDQLVLPNEIYQGYKDFGGTDPYSFAMYMMGVDSEDTETAEKEYCDGNDELSGMRDQLHEKLLLLEEVCEQEGLAKCIEEGQDLRSSLPSKDNPKKYEAAKKIADDYKESLAAYKNKLYSNKSGAEKIYDKATNGEGEKFDYAKFNYYLRYGMLIEQEEGIEYCVPESDYPEDFATDNELLQQMLKSGRLIIDTVEIGKDGKLADEATSVASNNSLSYTQTTDIDKSAYAKAEAEYEYAMKKIDKKDKQYDMELNKLETERTALTKEYDSVKKVIQDNIERTFGIFS